MLLKPRLGNKHANMTMADRGSLYPEYPGISVHTIVSGDAFPVIIPLIPRTNTSLERDLNILD
jgi:hypothetical protein